ncbi:MAG: lipopolysaccharide biosynthesis protein [Saccharofermentanales bacterium]|jgi:O-antigen/teichoic acid export membrane protein
MRLIGKNIGKIGKDDKTIIDNAIAGLFVKGGAIVVNFLMLRIYMQYFQNSTVLGAWLTILSILNWFLMFDLGIGNGLRNKLPNAIKEKDYKLARQYISSAYFFLGGILIILWIVGFAVIPYVKWNIILNISDILLSQTVLSTCFRIVYTGMILQLLLKIIQSILYAFQKAWVVSFITLLSNCIILVAVLLMNNQTDESNLIRVSFINIFAVNLPLLVATIIVFFKLIPQCIPRLYCFVKEYALSIFREGLMLLWLTIIFMVISSTNEFLISYLSSPDNVVEFQAYNRIYNGISSIFVVMLTPIWSAVTKAKVETNYSWIKKTYKKSLLLSIGCLMINLMVIPALQWAMNIWLGDSTINVNYTFAVVFSISNFFFVVHNVNTSFGNGFSYFKIQNIWMGVAAVVNIPLAVIFVYTTGSWIGVVIANIVSLLPFEVLEPVYFNKKLKLLINEKESRE